MRALSRREGKLILVTVTVTPVLYLGKTGVTVDRDKSGFSAISLTFFNRQIF